jgi:hypothetical protein
MKNQVSMLGVAALALLMCGAGYLFGYASGRSNTEEKSWSGNCEPLGEFYLCKDLRGFDYEAVDIQFAAMELAETEIAEGLQDRRGYSLVFGVALAVKQESKEPSLVAYYRPTDKEVVVVGSVPIAKVSEKVKAMKEEECAEDISDCNWGKIYYVSVYDEVVEWAGKIVAQVPDKKE